MQLTHDEYSSVNAELGSQSLGVLLFVCAERKALSVVAIDQLPDWEMA